MKIEDYNQATKILKNIVHIDKVLEFIKGVKNSNTSILMRECGFVSHPKEVILEKYEFDALIEVYENFKRKFEQELEEL